MGGQKRYRLQQKQRKWHKKGRRVNDIKARSLNKKDSLIRNNRSRVQAPPIPE